MEIPDQILEEIHQIKKQYEVDASGPHQRWPSSLRGRVEALLKSGVSPKELSEATGVYRLLRTRDDRWVQILRQCTGGVEGAKVLLLVSCKEGVFTP